jgi:hypothetical protein
MRKNKALLALVLVLSLFFLSQFWAEILFNAGIGREPKKQRNEISLGLRLFSLSARHFSETGFALLAAGSRDKNRDVLRTGITYFQKALRLNPLDYQARYYLAKAYLEFSPDSGEYFQLAVEELKRAALIRGNNKEIALDCGRVFFSLWPLLEEEDQSFASSLLSNAMTAISWAEFAPLLEMWSLYVQDTPLLMTLLNRRPEFFGPAADQLVVAGMPLDKRWELLNLYEIYILDAAERRFNELSLKGGINFEDGRSLLKQLNIRGYYRLQPKSSFRPEKLAQIRRFLLLGIITHLLAVPADQVDAKSALQTANYIRAYIDDYSDLADLNALRKVLEEYKFFKNNDFPSLYLKTLINYKSGNYGDIIAEIENLRQSISFVKKEQLADYTAILLLLVDSYYSSKLLTTAEAIASELYQNQPDNPDILFRVLRIQSILGDEGPPDKVLNDRLTTLQKSSFLTINATKSVYDVFLFNQPELKISLDPALRARLKSGQLLQVFVDGKIAYESYAGELPEKIVIGPPFTQPESKVKVQVNIS